MVCCVCVPCSVLCRASVVLCVAVYCAELLWYCVLQCACRASVVLCVRTVHAEPLRYCVCVLCMQSLCGIVCCSVQGVSQSLCVQEMCCQSYPVCWVWTAPHWRPWRPRQHRTRPPPPPRTQSLSLPRPPVRLPRPLLPAPVVGQESPPQATGKVRDNVVCMGLSLQLCVDLCYHFPHCIVCTYWSGVVLIS